MPSEFNYRFVVLIVFIFGIVTTCAAENVKKSVDEIRDDTGETNEESKDESLDIPVETDSNITCTRRQDSRLHEIQPAEFKQFPFMAAIMSHQNEYLCSGSVVSNGLILTTAQCTQQSISYVLLNTTKDKKDNTAVSLHVIKSEKFPTYTGSELTKDVAVVYTDKHNNSIASKIRLSNYTNPKSILDIEALGFGLNADVGQAKELQYVGLENRARYEMTDMLKGFFDCYETKVLTCFKDTGGPVIYNTELIGIVVKGQDECTKEMSAIYATNKLMAEILPTFTFKAWLDEKIKKNEDREPIALATYPVKPTILRKSTHKMTSGKSRHNDISLFISFSCTIMSFF